MPSLSLTEDERRNICFLAFPDSNSLVSEDTIFSFRIRTGSNSSSPTFQYGYVFFRQKRDEKLARGFLQKSVVLLSPLPYVGLFKKILEIMGPLYFQHCNQLLDMAYLNILTWPEPDIGATLDTLPILGSVLSFHVPSTNPLAPEDGPIPASVSASASVSSFSLPSPAPDIAKTEVVSNLQSINMYSCFRDLTMHLWLLWELVLTNAPILVISPSPALASEAVLALVSMTSPLSYCGDYRPYFTINQTDFKDYTKKQSKEGNVGPIIMGVTNPFFSQTFSHWPNILRVGEEQTIKRKKKNVSVHRHAGSDTSNDTAHSQTATSKPIPISTSHSHSRLNRTQAAMPTQPSSKNNSCQKCNGLESFRPSSLDGSPQLCRPVPPSSSRYSPQGIQSKTEGLMPVDKDVIRQLLRENSRGRFTHAANNEILRRHFVKLTEAFLIPLERYFATLMPLAKHISPFQPPQIAPFNETHFLQSLSRDRPSVTGSLSKDKQLYSKFLRSANFQGWLQGKEREARTKLTQVHLQSFLQCDLPALLRQKTEIEIVDVYLRLHDLIKVTKCKNSRERLQSQLKDVIKCLPKDLAGSILQSSQCDVLGAETGSKVE